MKEYITENSTHYDLPAIVTPETDEQKEQLVESFKRYFPVLSLHTYFPSIVYMLDYKNQCYYYVSKSFEDITGYPAGEMLRGGLKFFLSLIHPDDLAIITGEVKNKLIEKLCGLNQKELPFYRFSLNYRYRRSDGTYRHCLQQYSVMYKDNKGFPQLGVGILTDISFLKKSDNSIAIEFSKFYPHTNDWREQEVLYHSEDTKPVSQRELDVLRLIANGKKNKQIADILHISPYTVRAHRRNICEKTGKNNFNEIIALAKEDHWI